MQRLGIWETAITTLAVGNSALLVFCFKKFKAGQGRYGMDAVVS